MTDEEAIQIETAAALQSAMRKLQDTERLVSVARRLAGNLAQPDHASMASLETLALRDELMRELSRWK